MLEYYFAVVLLAIFLSVGTYVVMNMIVNRYELTDQDSKGYYLLAMLVVTLVCAVIAYLGGINVLSESGNQPSGSLPALGVLLTVSVSSSFLVLGLIKIQKYMK